ncbi:LOW QUALITY PROTEIN: protein FAM174C [Anomaloglossus baeobatrachus]
MQEVVTSMAISTAAGHRKEYLGATLGQSVRTMEVWCFSCLLIFMVPVVSGVEGNSNATLTTVPSSTVVTNSSISKPTQVTKPTQLSFWGNFEMMQRAFYVLIGISVLAVLYFVIRTCSQKKPQRKKYGLLSDYDDTMELGSMDSDEEKIFESRSIRR